MASNASDRPVIGLSVYVERSRHGAWDEMSALLPMSYVSAVIRSGGCPVLLPPSPSDATHVLSLLSGLIVTGGPDVDPQLYGAEPHLQTDAPRPERDAWESALCRSALNMDLPLLAICRGLQVLNVSLGGTLHQHLPDVIGNSDHRVEVGQMATNTVTVDASSALGSILGPEAVGMCHHHQAIDRLGSGVRDVAHAADGTIEAVELPGHGFALGVQWHPEDNPGDGRIFAALVEAARNFERTRS